MFKALKTFHKNGWGTSSILVLTMIRDNPGATQTQLRETCMREEIELSRHAIAQIITRLSNEKLLSQTYVPHIKQGRLQIPSYTLTPKAQALF